MSKSTENQHPVPYARNKIVAVFTLLAVLFATCVAHAQEHRADIPAIRCDSFTLTESHVRVSLQQVRSDADRVVGIQVDPNLQQSGSIEVGDFVTSPANHGFRDLQSFTAIGRERLAIANNSITVSSLDDCRGSLYVLLTVPAGTKVVISVNGKTEFAGIPVKGAILHRGKVVAGEFLGRHQLFSRLLVPGLDDPQLEIIKTSKGFSTSQEGLKKHLINFNEPANHPERIWGEMESVTLAIKIDAKGNVVTPRRLTGQEPFVSEALNALGQARFRPFAVNGLPVDTEADVTVLFFKDGRVSSTLK
jgi:hypothetical protein